MKEREYDFLPYEKAVQQMAREYAKVRPINIYQDLKEEPIKTAPVHNFFMLENSCYMNLEILMLLRQLRQRVLRQELMEQMDHLIDIKTEVTRKLEEEYFKTAAKHPDSPVVPKMITPEILRRLLYLESYILSNAKPLSQYGNLKEIEKEELKASAILDNIILIITSL